MTKAEPGGRITVLAPTSSVRRALDNLSSNRAVTSLDITREILRLHPEYAGGRGTALESKSHLLATLERNHPPEEWLGLVAGIFDPDVVSGPLHGRLMILGLCELDDDLNGHLEGLGLVATLGSELHEDFTSLLNADHAGDQLYRNQYMKLLQNRAKGDRSRGEPRTSGFVTAVRGGPGLEGLAELSHRQTYNHCLTARYIVPLGRTLNDAVSDFVFDMRALARNEGAPSGALLPDPSTAGGRWKEVADFLASIADQLEDDGRDALTQVTSVLQTLLPIGRRLVLFFEFRRLPGHAAPDTIGLTQTNASVLANLPERTGVVLSGVPETTVSQATGLDVTWLELPRDRELTRGQAPSNDLPSGPDRLGVLAEVNAIAEAVALKDMQPPMVVGVMGGWGSGKSFVLHLFENRIQEIRCEPLSTEDADAFPFVGHPYVIRFDAWTYAKGNLWASLMQQIFVELDRQVGLEDTLRTKLNLTPEDQTEIWRLLSNLSDEQRHQLARTDLGRQAIELAAQHDRGQITESRLWNQFEELRAEEIEQLKDRESELAGARVQRDLARDALDDLVDQEIRRDAARAAWETATDALIQAIWKTRTQESDKKDSGEGEPATGPPTVAEMRAVVAKNRALWRGRRWAVLLAFIAFILVGVSVAAIADLAPGVGAAFSLVVGVVGAAFTTLQRVQDWIGDQRDRFDADVAARRLHLEEQRVRRAQDIVEIAGSSQESIAGGASSDVPLEMIEQARRLGEHEHEVAGLEADVETRRQRVGIAARHTNLLEFVRQRLDGRYYEDQLGLLHQVKSDLEQLSVALLSKDEPMREIFPRGGPRVFLLIDDLDRCPPNKVVEVLEAVQLLVKTPLFVVLIAMDVRYVTRALEKEYVGVLTRGGAPSGLDYIEKIIQVPYRVRPAPRAATEGFLRSEMGVKEVSGDPDAVLGDEGGGGLGIRLDDSAADVAPEQGRLGAALAADTELRVLPTETVEFTEDDYRLISASCAEFEVSPRTMKRLVNVLKLLKIIWYRRGLDDGPPGDVKKTMLAVLAVAARYPEVMRHLLHVVERRYAAQEELHQNLIKYLAERCEELGRTALIPADWVDVANALGNERLFPMEVSFTELGEDNLRLIATFSFVGESDPAREAALQKDRSTGGGSPGAVER
jgi:hypothetical protein